MKLYVDLNSPYAYLALERAASVLGEAPEVEPILLGALFERRGWGSWAHTDQRADRLAELDARAARYGLPPLVYPGGWPLDGLTTMRAATWAKQQGRAEAFCRAVMRRQFADGVDGSGIDELEAIADGVGLDGVRAAVADPAVKAALREATEAAWDAGVRGIPTLRTGERLLFGDDQLEAA